MAALRKRFIPMAISIVGLAVAASLAVYVFVLDTPDAALVEAVSDRDSTFCRDFLRMTPESQRDLLRARATQFLFGIHGGSGLGECLSEYLTERIAAVERKCTDRGDFEAGSIVGQILVVGLRDCRSRAAARD